MELVSIIIPVYNVEKYLNACLESVVNQTYLDLEIILVNDGSTDKSSQICENWAKKDKRIIVIHKLNGGLSDARNVGMSAASGKYIAFIDSDDLVEPEYIEYLLLTLKKTGADLAECSYTRFSGHSMQTNKENRILCPVIQTSEEALRIWSHPDSDNYNIVVWNKLYPRELLDNEEFAVGYYGEDVPFTCRIFSKCGKIAHIDNELYQWRITPGSASKKFPEIPLHSIKLYFKSLDYLGDNYHSIATDCKVRMCSIINGFFYTAEYEVKVSDKVKKEMLYNRMQIKFSLVEWMNVSIKEKLIIIFSEPLLIGLYVKVKHMLSVIKQTLHFHRESK